MNSASFLVYSEFSGTRDSANYANTQYIPFAPILSIAKNDPRKIEVFTLLESNNEKYTLKKPVVALINSDNGEYRIECPQLELYAFNEDKNEVIKEFIDDFFDLCDDILPCSDSELGKYPKCWKEILQTIVRKNGNN
jgi:hypothetical protein